MSGHICQQLEEILAPTVVLPLMRKDLGSNATVLLLWPAVDHHAMSSKKHTTQRIDTPGQHTRSTPFQRS